MTAPDADPAPSEFDALLARARALLEGGDFQGALDLSLHLLRTDARSRDALYVKAVSLRFLNRVPDALAVLVELERHHPRFGRLYQERGHCHVTQRQAGPAIAAYVQAVNLNPALTASWAKLQALFRMTGEPDQAAQAAEHVATTSRLAPAVLTASALFYDGDIDAAEQMIRAYLLQQPADIEGMRLLARIAAERGAVEDAEFLLATLLEMAPDYRAARFDYASVLLRRHKYAPALRELDTLLALEPSNRAWKTVRATAYVGLGDHERALSLYRVLLAETPDNADLQLSVAHSLKTLGRQAEAIEAYRAAARIRPDFGDAYWSLANLKTYRFTEDEIDRMRAVEAAPATPTVDRYHACFALGKALEDRGDYPESYRYYERGNALKRAEISYDVAATEANARLQREVCSASFFAERAGWGCASADPIFIVGLPRAGSTLLEQILASHSQVEGTMELADVALAVSGIDRPGGKGESRGYPRALETLDRDELRRLGQKYLDDTRVYRSGKPFFIDKMPNNFRHIGLIHLMLPNARIIDARREPMACCFSNLKQLFASGQEFTYSIDDIARYYRLYVELMQHWDEVLPGRVLRVEHEAVVEDLEGNVSRLLDYCGLPFEASCLEFYRNERSVRTASSEQVRKPIFKEGLLQWRHYEPWLAPLRSALGDLVAPAPG